MSWQDQVEPLYVVYNEIVREKARIPWEWHDVHPNIDTRVEKKHHKASRDKIRKT